MIVFDGYQVFDIDNVRLADLNQMRVQAEYLLRISVPFQQERMPVV